MGEFASTIRMRAAAALRQLYRQESTPGTDPMLELIGFLLEEAEGAPPSTEALLTTEQWLTWNELALTQPTELVQTITSVLEQERIEFPIDPVTTRTWAACLVLSTLDRMEML